MNSSLAVALGIAFSGLLCACGDGRPPKSTEAEVRSWGVDEGIGGRVFFESGDCSSGRPPFGSCMTAPTAGYVVLLPLAAAAGLPRTCTYSPSGAIRAGDDVDYDLSKNTDARFSAALSADGEYALTAPTGEYRLYLADARDCATTPALRGVLVEEPIVVTAGSVRVIDMILGYSSR